jgi:hypothetical protein
VGCQVPVFVIQLSHLLAQIVQAAAIEDDIIRDCLALLACRLGLQNGLYLL